MFKPIDKFPEFNEYNDDLKYIQTLANQIYPDIDVDDKGNTFFLPSTAPEQFARRYNNRELKFMSKVAAYYNDPMIDRYIRTLNLDHEKFWYLVLFVYDFTFGLCIDRVESTNSPIQDIDELCTMIAENIESVNAFHKPTCKENMNLTLKIGKKTMVIDNEQTLYLLSIMGLNGAKNGIYSPFINSGKIKTVVKPDSPTKTAYCFAKIMIEFFNSQQFNRRKGTNVSNTEKDLICSLLYFFKLITNKSILAADHNYYKSLMSSFKDFNLGEINNYYPR